MSRSSLDCGFCLRVQFRVCVLSCILLDTIMDNLSYDAKETKISMIL